LKCIICYIKLFGKYGGKMKNNIIPELDKLFLEIGTYRKSAELKELFEFIKKFPHIAPYNAMLIHVQKPGSTYVATAHEWLRDFNRRINPGARPLIILRPFGPVSFVFELLDTYGEDPFPEEILNPFKVNGTLSQINFNRLIENMKCDGISYSEVDLGSSRAGSIQSNNVNNIVIIKKTTKEILVNVLYDMIVNRAHSLETKFATILHELGHLYCGHLGTPNEKWWSNRCYLDKKQCEFEAESVCWLVCERMGINNPSAQYLSGYRDNNDEIPDISIDAILKAVGIIETMINGNKEVKKEIVQEIREIKVNKNN
jgi:hypothetical protein